MHVLHATWALSVAAMPMQADTVPLYDDLGDHHYAVTTSVPAAQAYFDQGLRLYYAFNHQEAIRSFREAQRLDPDCAMCWWGEALAWGPNINLPMDSASEVAAHRAVREARARSADETPRERGLIDALARRYEAVPDPEHRARLDSAWAAALDELARRHPDDHEIAVLRGEAAMDLRPWDYWTDAETLVPDIARTLEEFERVLSENPDHPGACHFLIHAVEENDPERAVPCADRLAALMPGAGHLVHMPGHVYIRVGRYVDAIEANRHAVHADETYIRDQRPGMGVYTAGYYPHNYDFMAFAAALAGRAETAVDAAERMAGLISDEMVRAPGMDFLQLFVTRPLQMQVRFGRWDDVLATPAPPEDLPVARAVWHYARGRAHLGLGDRAAAERELDALRTAVAAPGLAGLTLDVNEAREVLGLGVRVLSGRLAAAAGDHETAVRELREAVGVQDALVYTEPPEWSVPVRHELGAVLLAAGRAEEAERVYREDLTRFPDNGWSLHGLARALRARGRPEEAAEAEEAHRSAWTGADTTPEAAGY